MRAIDIAHPLILTRRQVLTMMAVTAASAVTRPKLLFAEPAPPYVGYGYLTPEELTILDAVTALILPTEPTEPLRSTGAREAGAVDYIQSLLSFMPGSDANCDRSVNAADVTAIIQSISSPSPKCPHGGDVNGDDVVDETDVIAAEAAVFQARPAFASGPFSGRNPQPHFPIGPSPCSLCHGIPAVNFPPTSGSTVDVFPPDAFRQFLPLTRLQRLSWKVRMLGASAVPEVAANPLATDLLETDLRHKYRLGLAALDTASVKMFGAGFADLTVERQTEILGDASTDFLTILRQHVIEATLCAPEYGGNRDRLGWQLVGFDGDSQPQGYEIYDEVLGNYRERDDKPNSGPNPDEDCRPFSDGVASFLELLITVPLVQPAGHFPSPYCFEVD